MARLAPRGMAALAWACLPLWGQAQEPATGGDPLTGLDAYVAAAVEVWGIAGLSMAVVKDDSVVFARGYGVRAVGRPEPVDQHTIFAIGSNTKLFTAVTAGIQVDEGRMRWDDRAIDHLPGFQLHDPWATREIRIDDLLSHRSGLGRRGDLLWYGTAWSRDEILERIRYLEPNAGFRGEFGYQNLMFLAAGEAVAAAAGHSWDQVVRDRIFQPLGMHHSSTSVVHLPNGGNVATPHMASDGGPVPVSWRNLDSVAPAGSINSSAMDMTRWLRMLLADGEFEELRILSSGALAEIHTPRTLIPISPDPRLPSLRFQTYALGVVASDYGGVKLMTHTGGIDGMLSLVGYVPELDVGWVILTNTEGRHNLFTALQYRILDAYLGLPPRDWSAVFLEVGRETEAAAATAAAASEAERIRGTSPSLPLEGYVGRYTHPMYGDAFIRMEAGGLRAAFGPAFHGTPEHWHLDVFRVTWDHPRQGTSMLQIRLDPRGRVAVLEIAGIGEFHRKGDEP